MNEPFGFISLGYLLGVHAPGRFGIRNFFRAVHHVALCQAEGGRIVRDLVKNATIGTAFSCSNIIPYTKNKKDEKAAQRADALFNRLFLEPALGLGYPSETFPLLYKMERRHAAWRETEKLQFDFDFIGVQHYFPLVVQHNIFMPYVRAGEVKAKSRKAPVTSMGWEISGAGLYDILKRFASYKQVNKIIITESGASFQDNISEDGIHDTPRINYFREYLLHALQAKKEGVPLKGYFVWTLTDNFEWNEGYRARFGIVHVNRTTQQRIIKDSGYWFKEFLSQ